MSESALPVLEEIWRTSFRAVAFDGESELVVRCRLGVKDMTTFTDATWEPGQDPYRRMEDAVTYKMRYQIQREITGSLVGITWPM